MIVLQNIMRCDCQRDTETRSAHKLRLKRCMWHWKTLVIRHKLATSIYEAWQLINLWLAENKSQKRPIKLFMTKIPTRHNQTLAMKL